MTLEPMLQAQLIGRDPEACMRMARTYYRWAKQLYRKLEIDHPEELAKSQKPKIKIIVRIQRPGKSSSPTSR